MGDRCTGHCCQNFYLPLSPDELDRGYRRWKNGGEQILRDGSSPLPIFQDIHLIAPMVVYLGFTAKVPKRVNPTDEALLGKPEFANHRYRCKHYDVARKTCTIYDIRPMMCRDYPGISPCNYARCTWTERKAKKETSKQRRERLRILKAGQTELVEKAPKLSEGSSRRAVQLSTEGKPS